MRFRWLTITGVALVVVWMLWLRAPSFSTPIWNVDEGIAAALADRVLDGGLPYRHAIDQRPPVTYLVYAAVFAIAGSNNMYAIHVALALLVAATGVLLFLLVRRSSGLATAAWTLAAYATLSSCLFSPFDLFALHTEWPLSFCSTLGALLFFVAQNRIRRGWWFAAGLCYGAAALSKQPGLLDFAAPLALLALAWWNSPAASRGRHWRAAVWLAAGFATPVVATLVFFAAFGALQDFTFYTWTYNTRYYVAEVPFITRLASAMVPLRSLWEFSPVLTVLGLASILPGLYRRDADGTRRAVTDRPDEFFALVWLLGATYATTLSGRGFFHYSIQLLPPLAWAIGLLLGGVHRVALTAWCDGRRWLAAPLALALGVVAVSWGRTTLRYRADIPVHVDPVEPVAAYIRAHSTRQDKLFVWGFYSDLYTLTDRIAASRYLYSTFPTGVVPWINETRDTRYAIVPGTMQLLLRDLERNRPRYFVDTSQSLNRRFTRHPPQFYPELWSYLCRHYAEIEPERFGPMGFHVYGRLTATPYTRPGKRDAPPTAALTVEFSVPTHGLAELTSVQVQASDPAGGLVAMDLSVDGRNHRTLAFDPVRQRRAIFRLSPQELGVGRHEVELHLITEDIRRLTVNRTIDVVSIDEAIRTAPPYLQLQTPDGSQPGLLVTSTIKPAELTVADQKVWLCHAPMELVFPKFSPGRLQIGFGLVEGAYTPPNRTDGVEYRIELAAPDGSRRRLWSRLLRPLEVATDRGIMSAEVVIPADMPAGATLRFVTDPGPSGSSGYDWSFWTPPTLGPP